MPHLQAGKQLWQALTRNSRHWFKVSIPAGLRRLKRKVKGSKGKDQNIGT